MDGSSSFFLRARRVEKRIAAFLALAMVLASCEATERQGVSSPDGQGIDLSFRLHTGDVRCVPPPAGMTAWWPADGNVDDIIGGRAAILRGDATTGPGLVDQAFHLDGDGDFVDVPHDAALNLGSRDFTIDMWVLFNTTDGEQVLAEKWIQRFEPNASSGWTLTKLEDNALLLAMAGPTEEIGVASEPLPISAGEWIHIAATRQSGLVTLYMNGIPIASGSSPLNPDTESSLKFGHRGNATDTPGSESDQEFYLNGRLDEVELFVGWALTRRQIQSIVAAGSAGKCKR